MISDLHFVDVDVCHLGECNTLQLHDRENKNANCTSQRETLLVNITMV